MRSLTTDETDLNDAEWAIIEPMMPSAKPGGPRTMDIRTIHKQFLLKFASILRLIFD